MARGTFNVEDLGSLVCPSTCSFRIVESLQETPDGKTPYTPRPFNKEGAMTQLLKEDLVIGKGAGAESGNDVVVHYVGWLKDGKQFDSSRARRDPLDFALGAGDVIKGWDQGIEGMKVGGKRRLTIPAELAYGDQGCGGVIPPKATLVFEVEMLEIA
jgi:FKBP-type peptidyl-prolyl cis-trans isomerase FkpA